MTISNKTFKRVTLIMLMFLAQYLISSLFQWEIWGNILSPINAFIAAGILLFSYSKSDHSIKVSITLLLYALACTAWGIADTIWVILTLLGIVAESSPVIWIFYALTNCFLLSSLIIFAIEQFRKWDLIQFGIDLIISGFMTVVLFWIVFLHKDVSILSMLFALDYTSILSIITDILICVSIFSWFLSVRKGKIPTFLRITSFGLVLFAFVDMYYYYIDYNGLYAPNTIVDFIYILSLLIIAFGALWKTYKNSSIYDLTIVTNVGSRKRWVYLLLYPFFAVLFSITNIVDIKLCIIDFVLFAMPILFYWGSCKYVQLSISKEMLLKKKNEILEQRVAEQINQLTFLANQDTLTTLFNRRYFMNCVDDRIKSLCDNELIAVLLIDLDRFKTINDTYGHDVGDMLLINVSQRMIEWNNYGATIARLGGDEFAIMFAGEYMRKDIENFCVQIIDLCGKPISFGENKLYLTMSVGIALTSEEVRDGKTLLKQADISMYNAKSQGYNKYQFYNPVIDHDFKKTIEIEALLRQANIDQDFELFYQPQYSLPDIQLIGAEALIRWKNRELGFIPPNVFIPIAEEIDYIYKIGKWVIQESIHQSIAWNEQYGISLKVGFNISPKQFNDKNFIQFLKNLVTSSEIETDWIDAEITESVMIKDENHVEEIFSLFKSLGISVSIDDFGSGYSSLNCLNKYPFDRIKIDKSLIDNVTHDNENGVNVVKAVINMAHTSGIQAIAEGVESKEQLDILNELGCDQIQGYLLGRPVPSDVFEQRFILKHCQETVQKTTV